LLGEWFVLAIKLAKKKKQYLWQQGEKVRTSGLTTRNSIRLPDTSIY